MSQNSPREQLVNAIRQWILQTTDLTENQVRRHDQKYPEDTDPWCTILLDPFDIPEGGDVVFNFDRGDGTIAEVMTGGRRATLQVHAYGTGVPHVILERMYASLFSQRVQNLLKTEGFSVVPFPGGIADLSQLVDTDHLRMFMREFTLYYRVSLETGTLVTARNFKLDYTLQRYEGDPDALTGTITADDSEA